jgi:hypothetical protein
MSGALVVAWILGGNALALLLLNAMFSKGTSAMGGADSMRLDSRLSPTAAAR